MIDKEILISVIIPCYNVEKYIIKALRSLSEQTYKNFEVILIDDGSKDDTFSVINEYCKTANMLITLCHQENRENTN